MSLLGVYGASGCGRGVMPLLRTAEFPADANRELVLIDDLLCGRIVNGYRVLDWQAFLACDDTDKRVCIAIANGEVRQRLAVRCATAPVTMLSVRASNAVIMDDVVIGEGAVLSPFVTLTATSRLGGSSMPICTLTSSTTV